MLGTRSFDLVNRTFDYEKKSKLPRLKGSVGADLRGLEQDRAIKTDPNETRRRRTIRLSRNQGQSWGFTLQTYGIRNKRTQEIEVMSYVDNVENDGSACIAGMRRGDIILSVNGESVESCTHKDLVKKIQNCGSELRLVVLFEDCCQKVELHERYIRLKKLLTSKVKELRGLEEQERRISQGIPLSRLDVFRQSNYSSSSCSSDWDVYSEITSPSVFDKIPANRFAFCNQSFSDVSFEGSVYSGSENTQDIICQGLSNEEENCLNFHRPNSEEEFDINIPKSISEEEFDINFPKSNSEEEFDINFPKSNNEEEIDINFPRPNKEEEEIDINIPRPNREEEEFDINFPRPNREEEEIDINFPRLKSEEEIDINFPRLNKEEEIDINFPRLNKEEEIDINFPRLNKEEEIDINSSSPNLEEKLYSNCATSGNEKELDISLDQSKLGSTNNNRSAIPRLRKQANISFSKLGSGVYDQLAISRLVEGGDKKLLRSKSEIRSSISAQSGVDSKGSNNELSNEENADKMGLLRGFEELNSDESVDQDTLTEANNIQQESRDLYTLTETDTDSIQHGDTDTVAETSINNITNGGENPNKINEFYDSADCENIHSMDHCTLPLRQRATEDCPDSQVFLCKDESSINFANVINLQAKEVSASQREAETLSTREDGEEVCASNIDAVVTPNIICMDSNSEKSTDIVELNGEQASLPSDSSFVVELNGEQASLPSDSSFEVELNGEQASLPSDSSFVTTGGACTTNINQDTATNDANLSQVDVMCNVCRGNALDSDGIHTCQPYLLHSSGEGQHESTQLQDLRDASSMVTSNLTAPPRSAQVVHPTITHNIRPADRNSKKRLINGVLVNDISCSTRL